MQDRQTNEYSQLKQSSAGFFKKPYTRAEKCIHAYLSMNCCCDKEFKQAINDGQYVNDEPLIAYRADTRGYVDVFKDGFSAYTPARHYYHCDTTMLCCWLVCCPLMVFACVSSDPSFGLSRYKYPYVSNWSALALTLQFQDANTWHPITEKYWRYIVYMNGCILFTDFSNMLQERSTPIVNYRDYDYDNERMTASSAYDAKEIFPRDLNDQTIAPVCIIAAVEIDRDTRNQYDTNPIKFIFNKDFFGWNIIGSDLQQKGLNQQHDFPSLEIDHVQLQTIMQSHLVELSQMTKRNMDMISPKKIVMK